MTSEEKVKEKWPDADYYEEAKWWREGIWRKGIVPIWLGKDWDEAAKTVGGYR